MTTLKEEGVTPRGELDFERIRLVFANQRFGYVGLVSGLAMIYLTAATWSSMRAANLWLLAVALANIPRILLTVSFWRGIRAAGITADNILPWEGRMTAVATVAYLATVSSIFLPYGDHAALATLICAFIFMFMAAGGVLMLATSLPSIIIFLSLITLAIAARFFTLPEMVFKPFAAIVVLGYLQLLRLVYRQHRLIVENLALNIENTRFALFDPLTKLANRRQLNIVMDKLLPGAQRGGEVFSVILLDIDHFKEFNDSQGHNAGDQQLVNLAAILLECSRDPDLVVRYGGEEFLLVLPKTSVADAKIVAERIRRAVDERTAVTISAGIAQYAGLGSFEELVQQADAALYQAKNNGRDQVVVA